MISSTNGKKDTLTSMLNALAKQPTLESPEAMLMACGLPQELAYTIASKFPAPKGNQDETEKTDS